MLIVTATALSAPPGARADERPIVFPPALKPGDTIQFVAPAGPLIQEHIDMARGRLEAQGFQVRVPETLFRKQGYLAGTDAERAAELMSAFTDPLVKAIFPGTGGYGTTRILDRLDYDVIRAHPKILIGFSDITGLHLAIHQQTGLVTFHSPNPQWGLGSDEDLHPLAKRWFWRALLAKEYTSQQAPGYTLRIETDGTEQVTAPVTIAPGRARGRLTGGNLSVLHALMGTPYEIETAGRILFMEEIGEAPYRVDRMLSTLRLAGKLDDLAGVVLGAFTRRESEDTSGEETTIDEVLREYFAGLGVPVLGNFPVGHQRANVTLPVGVLAELDADGLSLRLLENPVRISD